MDGWLQFGLQSRGRITARGKPSALPIDLRYWTMFWIAEGKIARRKIWMERDEALEAAGLSE